MKQDELQSNSDEYDYYDDRDHDYNPPVLQEDEMLDGFIDFLNTEKVDLNVVAQNSQSKPPRNGMTDLTKVQEEQEDDEKEEVQFRIRKDPSKKQKEQLIRQNTSGQNSRTSMHVSSTKSGLSKQGKKPKIPVISQQVYGAQNQKKLPDLKEINQILALQKQQLIDVNQAEQNHIAMVASTSYHPQNAQNPQDDSFDSRTVQPIEKNYPQKKQFPSMLFEERPIIEIGAQLRKRYLVFRVYEDPIQIRPYPPPDRGYYFDMRSCDIKIIRYTLEDNGFRELPSTKDIQKSDKPIAVMGATSGIVSKEALKQAATIIWYVSSIKNTVYQSLQRYQKINHFPCSFYITRKDLMYKSVAKLSEVFGQKHFLFLPRTFILPNEYQYLQQEMKNDCRQWIFKPAAQAQGRGIFVTNKISEIPQQSNSNHNYVVSQYIDNPLLLNGYKFDMRIYVAITCINPLRIYIYEEGLARFATQKYDNNGQNNDKAMKYMHLTNYSINKKNAAFQKNSDGISDGEGSKWSITALRKMMRHLGIDDKTIWKSIEDIVIKTIISAEPQINAAFDQYVPSSNNCFELLGFDILIDDLFQAWLIEVNLSPSLGCDSPLDQKIKGNLIADLMTLSGIVPMEQRKIPTGEAKYTKLNGMYSAKNMASRAQNSIYNNPIIANKVKEKKKDRTKSQAPERGSSKTGNYKRDSKSVARAQAVAGWNNGGSSSSQKPLSRDEQHIVREAEDEFRRRGHFKRIFPTMEYHYYKQFFLQGERPLNRLLDERIMEKRRLRTTALIMQK